MDDKIKIVLADDHQLFREGIRSLLLKYDHLEVVGEAANGDEVIALLEAVKPSVVLLDLSMPLKNGFEVMDIAKKKFPDVKFIVLTMHDEGQYVVKSIKAGAKGYLLKNTDGVELLHAIEEVLFGRKYFNDQISELLINNIAVNEEPLKKLSERELEVLGLVAEGRITKEIADKLCVSTRTVETHRVNMMKKLNVSNSAELIKKAVELGLI